MAVKNKVQLITYADSLGGDLEKLNTVLNDSMKDVFKGGVHILPPFPSSGDRGFAPIDYFRIEQNFGDWEDIKSIAKTHDIVIDLMVNHISRQSEYFKDFLEKGNESQYKDLFITLDKIWPDGVPVEEDLSKIFLRRVHPYSEYEMKGGTKAKLWTTFGKTEPSEQIDVDVNSQDAREMFDSILGNFSRNGIKIVRLDAIGYVIKKMGTSCFFVEPEIYEFLDWIFSVAEKHGLELLPEVHSHYSIQNKLAQRGAWIYDFILPYRILEAIMIGDFTALGDYLKVRPKKQFTMLDCHDGVPVIPDLNDLVDAKSAKKVVDIALSRGSNLSKVVSDAHKLEGGFDVHQIRGTIYSILGEDDDDYILARAIQFFTPGIPQVYYVGALAGANVYERAKKTGDGREINRYNYSMDEIKTELERDVVKRLIRLINFRNNNESFDGEFSVVEASEKVLILKWSNNGHISTLNVDKDKNEAFIEYSIDDKIDKYYI
ncbi:MAG: sucrose phosphorylase [Clostridia bacterium]|nr:sucrose phosphorylase [Clostridia bacterium]